MAARRARRYNDKAEALATERVYSLIRHPEYVGYALLMLGFILLQQDVYAAIFLGAYWMWLVSLRIPREEMHLRRRFKDSYPAYMLKVRGWL